MTWVWTWLWVIPLVSFLGYTSHGAGLCAVRAVSEIMRKRRFNRMATFGRTELWAMSIIVPAIYFRPELLRGLHGIGPWWSGLAGGFLFGVGAALNQGCSFSTLQRLADRDWRMLATLGGILVGGAIGNRFIPGALVLGKTVRSDLSSSWFWPAMGVMFVWLIWEIIRMIRRRLSWRDDPAVAAMIIGLGAGLLFVGFGSWTYLNTLQNMAGSLVCEVTCPGVLELILVLAVVAGMSVSAKQRGTWGVAKPWTGWPANLLGGLMMGLGAAIIPGGNDALLLRLMPSLAPHSLSTYAALLLGVMVVLMVKKRRAIFTSC